MKEANEEFSFKLITLSHQNCPVQVREQFAFDASSSAALLNNLRDIFGIQEALLLSTCNRTELYYCHSEEPARILSYLARTKGVEEKIQQWFRCIENSEETVLHLLRVGAGLESRVLGDFQIINQVKTAYQLSADLDLAGPFLHRLLHSLFFLNKRIVQETSFRSGSASVAYACKELVEDLIPNHSAQIAIIGLGETGRGIALNLLENGFQNIILCNRSPEKAHDLLSESVRFIPFENWQDCLREARLVITAISGQHLRIIPDHIHPDAGSGFRYFIDLGVPRSVDPALEENPGIILYNIDQIQQRVDEALSLRRSAIPAVEAILEKGHTEFLEWTREIQVSPLIQQMKQALEGIRQEEMAKFLKKADPAQMAWAEEFSKSMVQRILKNHVVQLKAACRRGDAASVVEGLQSLFQLESEQAQKELPG